MKFSFNWLSEFIEGTAVAPRELERLITMKTAECEDVAPYGAHLAAVCAARLVSVEPLAGGHNKKVVVETGRYGAKTVVCGAPNCRPGLISAYVPSGTALNGREIRKLAIEGVESDGMLASGAELGINRDAAGILEFDAELGAPVPGCAPDHIIEIDNKSITHRPDLWGHHGLAREVAAVTRRALREPVDLGRIPSGAAPVSIAIEDLNLCPRYSALVFDNVTVKPSPPWLQYRLEAIGLNSINNIVDVTNFIMAELAQPMHAFDHDTLHGTTIFIRRAREGEHIVALNEELYHLDATNLVIADANGPIALAGVIGGLDTGINERTTRIVLESACFQASSIRKTSSKLKLRTDASIRFEKAQDPVNTVRGLARAVELFEQVSPGIRLVGGLADQKQEAAPAPAIRLPLDWLERKLGHSVDPTEVRDILERLSFGVSEPQPRIFAITVPSWRATRDISIKDDLVEEVGRMVGYDTITPEAPALPVRVPPDDPRRAFHRAVRAMVAAQGFSEVSNYSMISEEQARTFGFDPSAHVRVANPISVDQALMRTSLVPGIYKNILENQKHFDSFRLFEIGREIHKKPEGLPDEVPHLVAAIFDRDVADAELYELKRLAECLMPGVEVRPAEPRSYEHPARTVEVVWRGNAAGRLFELHPTKLRDGGRAGLLDLDLELVERLGPEEKRYRPVRRFPTSKFDLSVIAGGRELVGNIEKYLVEAVGESLASIEFLRLYTGPPIPEGQKSVSFRLALGAPDRTLTAEEAIAVRHAVIDALRRQGYETRA